MEPLEHRLFFSAAPHPHPARRVDPASTVILERANNPSLPIVATRTTWIIIHGWGAAPGSVADLAAAVDNYSSHDQVLVVDWSQLAATTNSNTAVDNTRITADALAAKIKQIGIPGKYINLIGFSLGVLVAGRLAGDLHASGGVNRIIALDPATLTVDSGGSSYTPNLDLKKDSNYSIVFHAGPNSSAANESADDSVLITNAGSTFEQRHAAVYDLFTKMTEANDTATPDAISKVFSLERILDGKIPAWQKNAYSGAYEAELSVSLSPLLAPRTLVFKDSYTRHTITITA